MTTMRRHPITLELLKSQENYFGYVQACLLFLKAEYQRKVGRISIHDRTLPKKIARPPLHGGPQ